VANITPSADIGRAAGDEPVNVTSVVAITTTAENLGCTVVDVGDDGSFDIELEPENVWGVFFIDDTQTGSDMFVGGFETDSMHSVPPNRTDIAADLGDVTVDSDAGTATPETRESDLLDDFDIDSATAETIGSQDEVLSRYSNPDVDNDGEVDCVDSATNYMFDFHIHYTPAVGGVNAKISDIIGAFLSDSATFEYGNTGVYIAYLKSFSSAQTGSVTFVDTDVVLEHDGSTVPANTAISGDDVSPSSFGDYYMYGPTLAATSDLPSGSVVFRFGDRVLSYTNVVTPSLEQLGAATNRIFPFIKFIRTTGCVGNCTMSGIGYKWMKKTEDGWEEATLEEITLLVEGENGATVSFRPAGVQDKAVTFNIPPTAVSGTVEWLPENANFDTDHLTNAEFRAITTEELCHVGISYDDKLGMRYFEAFDKLDSCAD
jgi:hypothetical protein